MATRLRWKQLRVGLASLGGLIAAAALVLTFGRVGVMRGKTIRLYVVTDAARGVIRGSEVWLDGQVIGVVKKVSFGSVDAPPSERLVLALNVRAAERSRIRFNSLVQIRAGANILGDHVVYINSGTPQARAVVDGDTLRATKQNDNEGLSSDAALATREFPGIVENVKLLAAGLKTAEGTLGALGLDHGGAELRRIRANVARLRASVSEPTGTVGLVRDSADALRARVTRALAQVDSIKTLMASDQHSLGRFRRDSSIAKELSRTHDELVTLRRIVGAPQSSISRVRGDSAILRAIHRDLTAIDSIRSDMKKHPLRYIPF